MLTVNVKSVSPLSPSDSDTSSIDSAASAMTSVIVTSAEVASSSKPPAVSESEKFSDAVPAASAVKFAVYSTVGRLPTPGQFPPKSVHAIDTNMSVVGSRSKSSVSSETDAARNRLVCSTFVRPSNCTCVESKCRRRPRPTKVSSIGSVV